MPGEGKRCGGAPATGSCYGLLLRAPATGLGPGLAMERAECGGADDEAEEGERATGTKYVANVPGDLPCFTVRGTHGTLGGELPCAPGVRAVLRRPVLSMRRVLRG